MNTWLSRHTRSRPSTSSTPIWPARNECSKYAALCTPGVSTTTVGSETPVGAVAAQHLQQPRRIVGDRTHAVRREQLGEHVGHRAPVLDDVRDARRRAHVVLEHAQPAFAVADEVDAGHVHAHVAGGLDPGDGSVKVLRRDHQPAGHDPVAHDLAGSVHVGEEPLEREHPLADTPLDRRPFGCGDDPGHEIERERPLLLARERERHAPIGKHAVAHAAPLVEVGRGRGSGSARTASGSGHGGDGAFRASRPSRPRFGSRRGDRPRP